MHQEQLRRVERWFQRLAEIDQGKIHDRPSDFYKDEVYAFFMNCYHLKDWIISDDELNFPEKKNLTERFINHNHHLSVCADICNSLKHLKLSSRPRSGSEPKFAGAHYGLELGGQQPRIKAKYVVETADGPMDAFELATRCLDAWRSFLNDHATAKP